MTARLLRGAYQFVDAILRPTKALPRAASALIILSNRVVPSLAREVPSYVLETKSELS
jgi:hypothetical protein